MRILLQRLPKAVPDKEKSWRALSEDRRLELFFALLVLAGTFLGAFLARRADASVLEKLDFLFNSNFAQRADTPSIRVFLASAASVSFFLIAEFLTGLAVWGVGVVPLLPFVRGLGLGMTGGYLLFTEGSWGFVFYLSVLLPGAFFSCLSVIWEASFAMRFSWQLRKSGLTDSEMEAPHISTFLQQTGKALLLGFVGAAVDTLTATAFAPYFPF